jgi:hypothetical protein
MLALLVCAIASRIEVGNLRAALARSAEYPSRVTAASPDAPGIGEARIDAGISGDTADARRDAVWEYRWYEEQIYSNRLSYYMLAQSFLVIAAVTATVSSAPASRWRPAALAVDAIGLTLTVLFWYLLTENARMLNLLKVDVERRYPSVQMLRAKQMEERSTRRPRPLFRAFRILSPSMWLSSGISFVLGGLWIALIVLGATGGF